MKYLLGIIISFLVNTLKIYSQNEILYTYGNPNLYSGESVVFTQEYNPPLVLNNSKGLFTPSIAEIEQAEKILFNRYNKDLILDSLYTHIKNVQKKYKRYNRQYLGYLDDSGDKIILINLLNFRKKKIAKEKFKGWNEEYIIGFGEYYEKNSVRYDVNLARGSLKLH